MVSLIQKTLRNGRLREHPKVSDTIFGLLNFVLAMQLRAHQVLYNIRPDLYHGGKYGEECLIQPHNSPLVVFTQAARGFYEKEHRLIARTYGPQSVVTAWLRAYFPQRVGNIKFTMRSSPKFIPFMGTISSVKTRHPLNSFWFEMR